MTEEQARIILPNTIVMWGDDPKDLGIVREIGLRGLYIDWEDGQAGWIAFVDLAAVSVR